MFRPFDFKFGIARLAWHEIPPPKDYSGERKKTWKAEAPPPDGAIVPNPESEKAKKTAKEFRDELRAQISPQKKLDDLDTMQEPIDPGEALEEDEPVDAFPKLKDIYSILGEIENEEFYKPMVRDKLLGGANEKKLRGIIKETKNLIVFRAITENWTRRSLVEFYRKEMQRQKIECTRIMKSWKENGWFEKPGEVAWDMLKSAVQTIVEAPLPDSWTDGITKFQLNGKDRVNPNIAEHTFFGGDKPKTVGELDAQLNQARREMADLEKTAKDLVGEEQIKVHKVAGKKLIEDRVHAVEEKKIPFQRELMLYQAVVWNGINDTKDELYKRYNKWLMNEYESCYEQMTAEELLESKKDVNKDEKKKEEKKEKVEKETPKTPKEYVDFKLAKLSKQYGIPISYFQNKTYKWEQVKDAMKNIETALAGIDTSYPDNNITFDAFGKRVQTGILKERGLLRQAGEVDGIRIVLGEDEWFDNSGTLGDTKDIIIDWNENADSIRTDIIKGMIKLRDEKNLTAPVYAKLPARTWWDKWSPTNDF